MVQSVVSRRWKDVVPGVFLFEDSCNVYALKGPRGMLVVDAGTGDWLEAVDELPGPVVALACTHYFRDHAAGAAHAARAGIAVYVPEGEREILEDPALHFLRRESYGVYTNTWDHFAPIEPTTVTGTLRDFDRLELAGLQIDVVPLPGATVTQVGLQLHLPEVGLVVFCGEAIHSPGRLARIAPLQYGYGDLPGAVAAIESAAELRNRQPQVLLPSLGEPILDSVDESLASLQVNLRRHGGRREAFESNWSLLDRDTVEQVTEHVWQSTSAMANATFVVAPSGKVLVIDMGYDEVFAPPGESASAPHRRRGSIRAARALLAATGASGIDVALVSHYHDDHVAGIPILQRVYGTACWCPEWFADILEHPERYAFPCTWPVATIVDRRIPAGATVEWEGIPFSSTPMSGHTRFSAAIAFEVDGVRFAHLGDQIHSLGGWGPAASAKHTFDWRTDALWPTHVYRNGADLRGFRETAEWLSEVRPDIVLSGHQAPMSTDDAFFESALEWAEEYEEAHRESMVLGNDDAHFGLDSLAGWITPYRSHLAEPGTLTVVATLRNPLAREAEIEARLVGPASWQCGQALVVAEPRAEIRVKLTAIVDTRVRRTPIAVELRVGGRSYGQVAEALVTVGGPSF